MCFFPHPGPQILPTEAVAGDGLVGPLARAARARDEDVEGEVGGEGAREEQGGADDEAALGHGVGQGERAPACWFCLLLDGWMDVGVGGVGGQRDSIDPSIYHPHMREHPIDSIH